MGAFEVFTGVLVFAVGGLCELEAGWERSLRWASPGDACHPTGPRRVWHTGQLPHGMWTALGAGVKPVSPALAGRFSTTGPLISGNFVGRIKGAKCPFDLQFLTWDFS